MDFIDASAFSFMQWCVVSRRGTLRDTKSDVARRSSIGTRFVDSLASSFEAAGTASVSCQMIQSFLVDRFKQQDLMVRHAAPSVVAH